MKLNMISQFFYGDGYSIQAENYATQYAKLLGKDFTINTMNDTEKYIGELKKHIKTIERWSNKNAVCLMNGLPQIWPRFFSERFKKFVGYCVIEGTSIPPDWPEIMNNPRVDKIFTCSNSTKRLFIESGVNEKKIDVIPHGVDTDIYNTEVEHKTIVGSSNDYFKFLYVNGWSKGKEDRKGLDLLLKAYTEEFKKGEKVELIIKINAQYDNKMDYIEQINKLNLPKERAKIVLLLDFYPARELASLYSACDAFVSPTKGEAFGMSIAEAMACELPVLVTENKRAGYMDFCNKETAYFIDVEKEIDVNWKVNNWIYDGSKWVEPSVDSMKKQLRFMFENQEEIKKKGTEGAKLIKHKFTWKRAAEKAVKILKELDGGK